MNCEFCSRENIKKATAENPNGLTLLLPDEKYICSTCLRHESNKSLIAA